MSDIEEIEPDLNIDEIDPDEPEEEVEDPEQHDDDDEEEEEESNMGEEDLEQVGDESELDEEDPEQETNTPVMKGGAPDEDQLAALPEVGGTVAELDEDILGDRNKKIKHHDNILYLHPGSQYRNMDEIYASSVVTRNENNIIVDALHKTNPIMTKYEKARLLGMRTKQLNNSKKIRPYVQVDKPTMNNTIIAEMELEQKKLPFIIERPLPGGGVEYWNVKDLEVI